MSKADMRKTRKITPQDIEIKERFTQFAGRLQQSRFQDPRGYAIRRTLTTSEQSRFNDSLPPELQKYREELRQSARDEQQIEDVFDDEDPWEEEELVLASEDDEVISDEYNSFRNISSPVNNTTNGFLGLDPNEAPRLRHPELISELGYQRWAQAVEDEIEAERKAGLLPVETKRWIRDKEITWQRSEKPHKLPEYRRAQLAKLAEHNSRQADNYLYGQYLKKVAVQYVDTGKRIIGGYNMLQPKNWADTIMRGNYY